MALAREGDTLVVSDLVQHGIYPTRHEEIDQTVLLRSGHEVQGGIYAKRLRAVGAGRVHGPVLTREDMFLDERHLLSGHYQEFLSGLTVPGVIRNEVSATDLLHSCVADVANATLRIRGPVIADTVHLTNALIVGNIHARTVTLEACVVFGVIECAEQLVLNNATFVAYRAGRARLIGRLSTWLGYGISDDGDGFEGDEARTHVERLAGPAGAVTSERPLEPHLRYLPICLSGKRATNPDLPLCDHFRDAETCNHYLDDTCPAMSEIGLLDVDFQVEIAARTEDDPDVRARYVIDGRTEEETLPLSRITELAAAGVPLRAFQLRTDDGDWRPLAEHAAFAKHRALRRVLSVTGRILATTGDIEAQVTGVKQLAREIAFFPYLDEASRKRLTECPTCRAELTDRRRCPECGRTVSPLNTNTAVELFRFGTEGAQIRREETAPEARS